MAKLTFVGGIHPYDGKDLSKDKPIKAVLPKGENLQGVVSPDGFCGVELGSSAESEHVPNGWTVSAAQQGWF